MLGSIYLRLVWRLLVLSNYTSQKCMEVLNRHRIHTKACHNVQISGVPVVGNDCRQVQMKGLADDIALGNDVYMSSRQAGIANFQSLFADQISSSGLNNNLAVYNLLTLGGLSSQSNDLNLLGHNVLPLKQGK